MPGFTEGEYDSAGTSLRGGRRKALAQGGMAAGSPYGLSSSGRITGIPLPGGFEVLKKPYAYAAQKERREELLTPTLLSSGAKRGDPGRTGKRLTT